MKVSVAMITYNHEKFIAKAIDSVLMQKTNFDYEIVIGEDCSTDNTRTIILEYQRRYPDKLIALMNKENLGMYRNFVQTHEACKGKYMALLEGDDYWTSPLKLQKQVDFLENHPECTICFHDSLIIHEDGSKEPMSYRPSQKLFSGVEDLLLDNYIPTSSVMFRRGLYGKTPDWIGTLKMGDWPIHILNAHHGKVGYINEPMAVYVVHPGGVWSTKKSHDHMLAIIGLFEALHKHLGPGYSKSIRTILRWRYFALSEEYEKIGNLAGARRYAMKSLTMHISMTCERRINDVQREGNGSVMLPEHITSIGSATVYKRIVRLYAASMVQTYVPTFYKLLRRTIARRSQDILSVI